MFKYVYAGIGLALVAVFFLLPVINYADHLLLAEGFSHSTTSFNLLTFSFTDGSLFDGLFLAATLVAFIAMVALGVVGKDVKQFLSVAGLALLGAINILVDAWRGSSNLPAGFGDNDVTMGLGVWVTLALAVAGLLVALVMQKQAVGEVNKPE